MQSDLGISRTCVWVHESAMVLKCALPQSRLHVRKKTQKRERHFWLKARPLEFQMAGVETNAWENENVSQ